jgi:Sodium:solute symporter family
MTVPRWASCGGRHHRIGSLSGAAAQGFGYHRRYGGLWRDFSPAAIWIGADVVTAYVTVSGIHGSAWTAVVKDTTILAVVLFLGIYLPLHYYGGYGAMFAAIQTAKPNFLALPAQGESLAWFDSTVLLTALGFYMWPHTFGSLYTAKEERAFRRNAAMLPLYQLIRRADVEPSDVGDRQCRHPPAPHRSLFFLKTS